MHSSLIILACAMLMHQPSAGLDGPNRHKDGHHAPLTVELVAEKKLYQQEDSITVSLIFSNNSADPVTLLGPFMIRNAGVCGILDMDGYWCASAPAELSMNEETKAKELEAPLEIVIEPRQTRKLKRVLLIPHGTKDVERHGKKVIDGDGQWAIGTHELEYSYTCSLFNNKHDSSAAQAPFVVLGIKEPSRYWQGNLRSQTIKVEVRHTAPNKSVEPTS